MDVSVVSHKEFENDSSTSEDEEFPDETDFKVTSPILIQTKVFWKIKG